MSYFGDPIFDLYLICKLGKNSFHYNYIYQSVLLATLLFLRLYGRQLGQSFRDGAIPESSDPQGVRYGVRHIALLVDAVEQVGHGTIRVNRYIRATVQILVRVDCCLLGVLPGGNIVSSWILAALRLRIHLESLIAGAIG